MEVVMVEEAVERPAFLAEEEVKLQVSTTTGTPSKVTAADAFQMQMIQLMHALRQDNLRLREEQLKIREGMMEQQKVIKHMETIRASSFDCDGIFKTLESDEKEPRRTRKQLMLESGDFTLEAFAAVREVAGFDG